MNSLLLTALLLTALYSIATPAPLTGLAVPGIVAAWNGNSLSAAEITVYGNGGGQGYRICRANGYSSAFRPIAELPAGNTDGHDTITFYDSTVAPDAFYSYRAVALRGADSACSPVSTIYTFQFSRPKTLAHFTRLGTFPITLSGWSALAGDSIIAMEGRPPYMRYSVIDVADPAAPREAGHLDSSTLAGYPLRTLIPLYLKFGTVNGYGFTGGHGVFCLKGRYAVVVNSPDIAVFQPDGKGFRLIGKYKDENIVSVVPLNDSLLCAVSGTINAVDGSYSYLYPMRISAAGELFVDNPIEVGSNRYGGMATSLIPYMRGVYNHTLLIGETFCDYPYNSWQNMVAYDLDSMQSITFSDVGSSSWGSYSGYPLSGGQFLSLDESHLYAEDPTDLNSWQTAVDNKAVLPDTLPGRRNVLVDTVKHRLYIIYPATIAIYGYTFLPTAKVATAPVRGPRQGALRVLPARPGVNIVFPGSALHADLYFYDLFGRLVDKVTVNGSNAVFWRPKETGNGCFTVSAKIDGVSYSASFVSQ